MLQCDLSNSKPNASLFIYKENGKSIFILVYVDDILVIEDDANLIKQVISKINNKFAFKILKFLNYFLGFEAFRNVQWLYLTQCKYIFDLLQKTNMATTKPCPNSYGFWK